jgi:16S rRNA (guanine527-N7)-methyltransferase
LVLAWRWPDQPAVLVEASLRRSRALERAVTRLGWSERVTVLRDRAEEVGRSGRWRASQQAVVARSFGAPAVVAECAAPLLAPGGILVVSEPPPDRHRRDATAGNPDRWPPGPLAELGLEPVGFFQGEFGYQVLTQDHACPNRFPRRTGVPGKRPLY